MNGRKVIGPVGHIIRNARIVARLYRQLVADGDTSLDKLGAAIQVLEASLKVHDDLERRRHQ